jgi:S1-C subfamily serine protease
MILLNIGDFLRKVDIIVATVVSPSPAAECGLKAGDIITNFKGIPIKFKYESDDTTSLQN